MSDETEITESKVESGLALARIPGFPSVAEVDLMRGIASEFVKSGLLPQAYGTNPASVFLVMQQGRELGLAPMQAINGIHVIKGKVTMSAQLMGALINQSKAGLYHVVEMTNDNCTIEFERDGRKTSTSFTIGDAKLADLVNKDNWQRYPADMLFNRCFARGARKVFPDIIGGFYTPDEIEDAGVLQIESTAYDTAGAVVHDSLPVKAEPYEAPTDIPEIRKEFFRMGYTSEQLDVYMDRNQGEEVESLRRALADQNEEDNRGKGKPEVSYLSQLLPSKDEAKATVLVWGLIDNIMGAKTKDDLFMIEETNLVFIEGVKEYPELDKELTAAFEQRNTEIKGKINDN